MNISKIVITLALCVTALVAARWIVEGQRYEVVAAGAGSGGSQDATGSTDVRAYVVDRKTGKTWLLSGGPNVAEIPALRLPCPQIYEGSVESESGCERH